MTTKKLRDSMQFVGALLRRPASVGAVLPSSRYLARAMVKDLALQAGDLVVEYGPGTGPMTSILTAQIQGGVHYLGVELDQKFHEMLSQRFPGLDFQHGSVEDIEAILSQRGLPKAKVIVSGLPFASLPEETQRGVARGTRKILAQDGEFRTFQYLHAYGLPTARRFRSLMQENFGYFKRSPAVLRNVPPAYVLSYRHHSSEPGPEPGPGPGPSGNGRR